MTVSLKHFLRALDARHGKTRTGFASSFVAGDAPGRRDAGAASPPEIASSP